MTDEIKKEPPTNMDFTARSDGTTVNFTYHLHEFASREYAHCYAKLESYNSVSRKIVDGVPGEPEPMQVGYTLKCEGGGSNRDELIALFRRLADDLENHDYGDDD